MSSVCFFFFSSRRRHTRCYRDWSSDVCSSDLLLPIGGYEPRWFMQAVHMNPEEAVRALRDLGGSRTVMVPMHWGTFKLTDEAMDEPPVRAHAAWREAGLPVERFWLLAHGESRGLE